MESKNPDEINDQDDPKGHPALELTYKEGSYYLPHGAVLIPDFGIGPEEHQKRVFVEYERTFGRGLAFDITHRSFVDPRVYLKYGGFDLVNDYLKIANNIRPIALNGTKDEADEVINKIKDFRRKYSALYSDVE